MDFHNLENDIHINNKPIGYGSFSVLYKGFNFKLSTYVAVKQINKIPNKKYLNNEIKVMKNLNHPNVLKLFEVYSDYDKVYLVVDLCDSDLKKYIDSRINIYDQKYFGEIIEGIGYMYKKNIIHRDIKPQNILIKDNVIKICDFGMSKTYENFDLMSTFCGSPLYMAPEIIKEKKYNNLSDIWSLGVVLFELVTKEHPYMFLEKDNLWQKVKNDDLKINFSKIQQDHYRVIISSMLVEEPMFRCNYNEINDLKINEFNKKENDIFEIENDFTFEINDAKDEPLSDVSQSLIVPSEISRNYTAASRNGEIISKSDPVLKGKYFENYIEKCHHKINQESEISLPLYGVSPGKQGKLSSMIKSYDKLKNIFSK